MAVLHPHSKFTPRLKNIQLYPRLIPTPQTKAAGCLFTHKMESEMQNSNPTILNAADLPTRLRPTLSRKPGIFENDLFASALPSVYASEFLPESFISSSESEGDDDLLEEPIDEQEIYGKAWLFVKETSNKTTY